MWTIDPTTGNITMHAGDTGAYKVHATRRSGDDWTSDDRMLFTVLDGSGQPVIQRYYRLDTELGNGYAHIQFNNSDTDSLAAGVYRSERRYIVNPRWDGQTIPTGDVTDALTADVHIIEGDIVRTPVTAQTTIDIQTVYGEV